MQYTKLDCRLRSPVAHVTLFVEEEEKDVLLDDFDLDEFEDAAMCLTVHTTQGRTCLSLVLAIPKKSIPQRGPPLPFGAIYVILSRCRKLEDFYTLGPITPSMYRTLAILDEIQAELRHIGALADKTMAAIGLALALTRSSCRTSRTCTCPCCRGRCAQPCSSCSCRHSVLVLIISCSSRQMQDIERVHLLHN
jgi:hypothetical protein